MKLKKRLPWWVKIVSKLLLSRLPFRYQVWQLLGLFRHGKMDNTAYALKVFRHHVEHFSSLDDLHDKVLVEVGRAIALPLLLLHLPMARALSW